MPVVNNARCIVLGCPNRRGEGGFVGDLCSPCDTMLRSGVIGNGETFIHKLKEVASELYLDAILGDGVNIDSMKQAREFDLIKEEP